MGYLSNSDDLVRNPEILELATAVRAIFKAQNDSHYGKKLNYIFN